MNVSNRRCISRIAWRALRAGRARNTVAVLAIALTTLLFTSLFTVAASISYSFEQQNFRMAGGDMHGTFKDITWEQVQELRRDPLIQEAGTRLFLGMPGEKPFHKAHVEVSYMDPVEAGHYFCTPAAGTLPEEGTDQAATDTRVLALLGVEPEIGARFTVTYDLGSMTENPVSVTQTFTLSGWWEYDEAVTASNILVPLSRARETLDGYESAGSHDPTGLWSLDVLFSSSLHIRDDMEQVLRNSGCQCTDPDADDFVAIGVNWGYSGAQLAQNFDPLTAAAIAALLLLIMFCGYLIIYNVFQISVTGDIRFYGLLKTVGTTGRQIRRIIRRQALALSLAGIPLGLLAGFFAGSRLTPVIMAQLSYKKTFVSLNPLIFAGAAAFALITVLISCRRPGRIAARVSPVEAAKYTEGSGKAVRRAASDDGRGGSLRRMALANLGRSRTRTALVVASLSLAVVLMNMTVTFTNGFDMDKYLRNLTVTDFIYGHADYFQSGFRTGEQAVTEEMIAKIDARGGISESGRIYGQTSVIQEFVDEEHFRDNWSRRNTAETLELMVEQAERLPDGRLVDRAQVYGMEALPLSCLTVLSGSLEKLDDSDGRYIAAVYSTDDYNEAEKGSNWAAVGDTVTLRYVEEMGAFDQETGEEIAPEAAEGYPGAVLWRAVSYRDVDYEVVACVTVPGNEGYRFYGANQFILGAETFRRDSGTADIMTYLFNMENDGAEAAMADFLAEYTGVEESAYDFESRQSYVDEFSGFRSMFLTVGTALSAIVGLVGVLNFVNAMLTGIIARRREFAVLQAVGMTGRQLKKLLIIEGLLYTGGAVAVSLALGAALGLAFGRAIGSVLWFFTYRFTVAPILAAAPVFAALGVIVPLAAYRALARSTVVERLRGAE